MRVFIGLTEVSGYYSSLKRGFDALGVSAEYVSLYKHPFLYGETQKQGFIASLARYCVARRVGTPEERKLQRAFWLALALLTRLSLFIWAALKFDIFIFGGGSTFFRFAEFPILRLLGKKIIYVFHGTDSRPAYIDGFCPLHPGQPALASYLRVAKQRKSDIRKIERHAHVMISVPSFSHFLTKPFVNFLIIGIPRKFEWVPASASGRPSGQAVRVLHSPSQLEGKGTVEIRKIVEAVKRKGYAIDFIELSGKPNAEVIAELQRCDFVIDQLYADTPMAGFAAEAALYGKPAVVGGYYSEKIHDDLREECIPPSLYCHPGSIQQAIEKLVVDKVFRLDLGRKAKEFVEKNWTEQKVASHFLQLIEGDIPSEWLCDPCKIRYVHGMGLPETTTKTIIRGIIEQYGKEALLLSDKSELEKRFVKFAFAESRHVAATF